MTVVKWEGFADPNKTQPEWKAHSIKAYKMRESSGVSEVEAGYHGAANAYNDNEHSLDNSLAQLQLTNNVNM